MNAPQIIEAARLDGLAFEVRKNGKLFFFGPRDAVRLWVEIIKANKPEIIEALTGSCPDDDRITCRRCGRLAGGVCGAAKDRTLPNTGPRYAPEPERLRRCLAYVPALLEPDKRTGLERWPHGRKA